MLKRILSCIITAAITVGFLPAATEVSAADSSSGYAEYTFGSVITNTNVTGVLISNKQTVEKDGKQALVRTPSDLYMYVSLNSNVFKNEAGQPVKISVEYYDEGTGCFTLAYDGPYNTAYPTHSHTNADDIVYMTNDKKWKVHDFYLDDISFAHKYVSGYDFRVALWSDEMGMSDDNIYIHSVKVEKLPVYRPYRTVFSSEMTGNNFGPKDDKRVTVSFSDRYGLSLFSSVEYKLKDSGGSAVLSGSFSFSTAANGSYKKTLDLNSVKKFGLYTLEVTVKTSGLYDGSRTEFTQTDKCDFAYINKPEVKNPKMNAVTHGIRWGEELTADIADYAGFGYVRDEIAWAEVEKTMGVYAVPDSSAAYTSAVEMRDMNYMLILDYGNALYDTDSSGSSMVAPHTDAGLEAWGNYCRYMAQQYKGYIKTFEVWNEYNLTDFNPTNENEENYVKMCKIAYEQIKAVIPDAEIVGMCFAGTDPVRMRKVFELGGYEYMDAVSCHPYDWSGSFDNEYFVTRLREVCDLLDEYAGAGNQRKPLYLSEFGTTDAKTSTGVSTSEQAASVLQVYTLMQGENIADKMWWYCLVNKGVDIKEQEYNWGLVKNNAETKNGTPFAAKPAYAVMAGMNSFLTSAEALGKIISADKTVRAYRFKSRENDNIAVMWSMGGNRSLFLSLGCNEIEVYDMYTNKLGTFTSEDGIYGIELTNEPVYIRGDFKSFCEDEGNISFSGDGISIKGNTKLPSSEVTCLIKSAANPSVPVYLNQVTSGTDCGYSFTARLTGTDVYTILVNDGSLRRSEVNTGYTGMTVRLMRGSTVITDLSQIANGDTITAEVRVTETDSAAGTLELYAAVKGDSRLINVSKRTVASAGTYTIPISIDNADEVRSVIFMLWDNSQKPAGDALLVNK